MRAESAVAGRRLHTACVNLEASMSQPCTPASSGVSALQNQLRDKLKEAMQLQARFDAEKVELNSRYNMSVCLRTRPIHFSTVIYKCHHAWAACCNKYIQYWQLGLNYRIQRISQCHKFQHLSLSYELNYWCPELTSPRCLIVHCPECWHTGKVSTDCLIYPTMWHAKTREKECVSLFAVQYPLYSSFTCIMCQWSMTLSFERGSMDLTEQGWGLLMNGVIAASFFYIFWSVTVL